METLYESVSETLRATSLHNRGGAEGEGIEIDGGYPMCCFNVFVGGQLALRRDRKREARQNSILKMRNLSNQRDDTLFVTSVFGGVMRIGMKMGVRNSGAVDNVRMGKESRTYVVISENDYENQGYYFLFYFHTG